MAYKVTIRQEELIDALEEQLGDVYQNIEDEDRITKIHYSSITGIVEITIGEE